MVKVIKKSDSSNETNPPKKSSKKTTESVSRPLTMKLSNERDIATDFGMKVYKEFNQMIKSVILFGSSMKKNSTSESDIDIIVIIDDVAVMWDQELIAWYREELGKLIKRNPYVKPLHINTVKLTTWWHDMMKGDPVVMNILRYGDAVVDFGGFFNPLKILLKDGKIKSTPESIYTLLQRAPNHLARARQSMLGAVDGLYWTMVDSAHAALITAHITPASPEDIPKVLTENFVKKGRLHKKYVKYYEEVHKASKEIIHGKITSVGGKHLDDWFNKADKFLGEMAKLVDELIDERNND